MLYDLSTLNSTSFPFENKNILIILYFFGGNKDSVLELGTANVTFQYSAMRRVKCIKYESSNISLRETLCYFFLEQRIFHDFLRFWW